MAARAARITSGNLTRIFLALPEYDTYEDDDLAQQDEVSLRRALGEALRLIGDRLMLVGESRDVNPDPQKLEIIDMLVDEIGGTLKVLNRSGAIQLQGERRDAITALETVDMQLMMLLEQMEQAVVDLLCDDAAIFPMSVRDLSVFLDAFLDLVEERNRLLGMGWESEMRLNFFPGLSQEPS